MLRTAVALALLLVACDGDEPPGFDLRLGESCGAADECGDARCISDVCSVSCDSAADCPQFAVCADLESGARGCLWSCSDDSQCPTTTPVCVGSGFGVCRE